MKSAERRDDKEHDTDDTAGVRVVDCRWWARGDTPDAEVAGARKPTVVEELERRLNDANAQVQQVTVDHRRALEEFEQVRLRLRRDTGREIERARRAVLAELLDVLDNLDRAVQACRESSGDGGQNGAERLARGIELVRDQFLSKLEAFAVIPMAARGQVFDAKRHEAVGTAPVDEPGDDGLVVGVVREGYAIGDEVLRPASVVVGKHARE